MVHPGAISSQPQSITSREASLASGMEANIFSTHYQPTTGPPSHLSFPPELERETNMSPASYRLTTEAPLTPLSQLVLGASPLQFQSINSRAASPVSGMRTNITSSLHQLNNEPISEESLSPAANICNFISNTFGITGEELKSARYNSGKKKVAWHGGQSSIDDLSPGKAWSGREKQIYGYEDTRFIEWAGAYGRGNCEGICVES